MSDDSTDATVIPGVITAYQRAHDRRDVVTAVAQFAAAATVVDDGRTYEGLRGVEDFVTNAASEYAYTRTLVAAAEIAPDTWRVTNHLEGDFPGGQVDLSYEFQLVGGLIARLTIAP